MTRLKDTPEFSWHRLRSYPDRIDKAGGPTAFWVSWHRCRATGALVVTTADRPGGPSTHITGVERTIEWLDTPTLK